jgi:hypothetical protein
MTNKTFRRKLNVAEFDAKLIEEGSWGYHKLGAFKNRMEFVNQTSPMIIWNYGKQAPDEDETLIGLTFEGKELVDYDGVMSMPEEAVELLECLGYNCDYVKNY